MAAKFSPPCGWKLRVLDGDLFQRFQAVGRKSRSDHREVLDAALGEAFTVSSVAGLAAIRRGRSATGMSSSACLVQPQLLAQQPRRLDAWS